MVVAPKDPGADPAPDSSSRSSILSQVAPLLDLSRSPSGGTSDESNCSGVGPAGRDASHWDVGVLLALTEVRMYTPCLRASGCRRPLGFCRREVKVDGREPSGPRDRKSRVGFTAEQVDVKCRSTGRRPCRRTFYESSRHPLRPRDGVPYLPPLVLGVLGFLLVKPATSGFFKFVLLHCPRKPFRRLLHCRYVGTSPFTRRPSPLYSRFRDFDLKPQTYCPFRTYRLHTVSPLSRHCVPPAVQIKPQNTPSPSK